MSIWDSTDKKESKPTGPTQPKKSIWDTVPAAPTKATTTPIVATKKASTTPTATKTQISTTTPAVETPYFSAVDKKGNSFGFSDTEKDPNGTPLFAYRKPGDTSTTTDKTRVAIKFDPRVPQKLTKEQYYNPRMVKNVSDIKQQLGGAFNDELDHKIALAVGGSNELDNLQSIPGPKNQEYGHTEAELARKVAAGEMSYFDAQVADAKQKGIDLPFTGKSGFFDSVKDVIKNAGKELKDDAIKIGGAIKDKFVPKAQASTSIWDTPVQSKYQVPTEPNPFADVNTKGNTIANSTPSVAEKPQEQEPTIQIGGVDIKGKIPVKAPQKSIQELESQNISLTAKKTNPIETFIHNTIPAPLRYAANNIKEALFGKGQQSDIAGNLVETGSLLKPRTNAEVALNPFFGFTALLKSDREKVFDRYDSLVAAGIPEKRADEIAKYTVFGNKNTTNNLITRPKKVELTQQENDILNKIGRSEIISSGLDALGSLPGGTVIGSIGKDIGAASKIARATEEEAIIPILKEVIPNLTDDAAKAFARPLTLMKDANDIQTVLNRIDYNLNKVREAEVVTHNITGDVTKATEDGAVDLSKPVIKTVPVNDLNEVSVNNLEKNSTGMRENSVQYFVDNPQEIKVNPIKVREVEGKIFIEDGRHRLEAARQIGIDNLKVEDVTPHYPEVEGQAGKTSDIIHNMARPEPESRTIRDTRGKYAGSRPKSTSPYSKEVAPLREKVGHSVEEDIPTEVQTDYREVERGNKELNKELKKEAPKPVLPIDKKIIELQQQKVALGDRILNNPARDLAKYANSNGELPEVLGEGGIFGTKGDELAQNLGYKSSEDARLAYENHRLEVKRFKEITQELNEARAKKAVVSQEDREAKSIGSLLEKNAKRTDVDIRKQERMQEIKKSVAIGAERAKKESDKILTYNQKIAQAKIDSTKSKSVIGKIKAALNPIKSLDPRSKKITTDWFTKKIKGKDSAKRVFYEQQTKGPQNFKEITDFQAGKNIPYIKEFFDDLGTDFQRRGLQFHWRDDYIPQVYNASEEKQALARLKYMREKGLSDKEIKAYLEGEELPKEKALRLKLYPNFVKERFWPDYETAIAHGLPPKYTTPAQIMAYYKEAGETAIANREFIDELKQEAKLLPSEDAPDTWKPVTLRFAKEGLYAPPELADLINGKFRDENNLNIYERTAKTISGIAEIMQDTVLSAGVPFTNINYFSLSQAVKLVTTAIGEASTLKFDKALSSLKASFAYIRANSNTATAKWFYANRAYITKMAENGISIAGHMGDYETKNLYNSLSEAFDQGEGIKNRFKGTLEASKVLFAKAFNEKTFKNFMPQVTVQIFKDSYKSALRAGLTEREASKLATDTTLSFQGMSKENGRSSTTGETLKSIFFAPKYREGLINIFANAGKGWSTEFRNPAYAKSRSLVIGLAITYVLYNLLNKKLNGQYMWDNPSGREFSLRIPRKNGDTVYVEFGPSLLSIPRNLASGTIALFKGDFETTKQKYGSIFSMPVKVFSELLANKDYFGNPIYKDTDSVMSKIGKGAAYVGLEVNHPFIAQSYKYWAGKQPLYQSLSYMLELPFKYSNLDKEQASKYYNMQDKQNTSRTKAKDKVRPIYEKNQQLKTEGKIDEANAIYDGLSDADRGLYDQIKKDVKTKDTKARKVLMQKVYDDNQQLKAEGRVDDANAVYNNLSEDDQHAYDLIKTAAEKTN